MGSQQSQGSCVACLYHSNTPTCECSIAPPWAVKCTGVSRVAVYTPVGGTGSAGGLLTRDILRRVFPVEEGQQARRSAIMCPHELHYEGQRGLRHRGANGWRLATRGPRGKVGRRQDAVLGTNASSGAASGT